MKSSRSTATVAAALLMLLAACVPVGTALTPPAATVTPSPVATFLPTAPPGTIPSEAPSTPTPVPVQPATDSFTLTRNVQYGTGGSVPLILDSYAPSAPLFTPVPAVVFIHGGGWAQGDKYPNRNAEALARRGFFVVSINYRLSGVSPFPAAIEDCKCAVRWLRAHAQDYNVDPQRIGVWGSSAGGHLSLLVGTADASAGLEGEGGWTDVSSRVQAVCSWFGPSDFVTWVKDNPDVVNASSGAILKFMGKTPEQNPAAYQQASPVYHVSPDDPPLIMFHGDRDRVVPLKQSQLMYEAYRKAGLGATLVTVTNGGHGFAATPAGAVVSPSTGEIQQSVAAFFASYLGQTR